MPALKKRYTTLLIIALLVPALLLLLPQLVRYTLVKLLEHNLQVQAQIEDVDLNLFTGRALIRNLSIAGHHQSSLHGARLAADLDMGQLLRGNLVAESISLQGMHLQVLQTPAGEPVLLVPLAGGDQEDSPGSIGIPLFSLQQLELIDVQVDVNFMQLQGRFKLDKLLLSGLSTLQSQPARLQLQGDWNGAPLAVDGTLAPFHTPAWFEGELQLDQIQLRELNPYLPTSLSGLGGNLSMHWQGRASSDHIALTGAIQLTDLALSLAHLQVHAQALSWSGGINASASGPAPRFTVTGTVSGTELGIADEQRQLALMEMEELELRDFSLNQKSELHIARLSADKMRAVDRGEENQRLLYAGHIQVLALSFQDDLLTVGAIEGEDVDSTLRLTSDGDLVSRGVLTASLQALLEGAQEGQPAPEAGARELQWRFDSISIHNSRLNFFDEQFEHPLQLELAVDELILGRVDSRQPQQPSELLLDAGVGDFGRIKLDGEFAPLAPAAYTRLTGEIDALPMPLVSPYVEQLLGYELIAGQFDHEFDITILNQQINASNELNLRKLEVKRQENVAGRAPLSIPLGFALDLLRDNNDHIELSVPLEGQLDDPQFGLDQAISRALGTALQAGSTTFLKLALQPYGAIWMGAELGLKLARQVRLDPMPFPALQAELGVAQLDYAGKLALILSERPGLHLQLCGKAGGGDFVALQQRAASEADVQEPASFPSPEQEHQMRTLADARARSLKHWLVKERGIDSSRLYLCKAEADREGEISGVKMSL